MPHTGEGIVIDLGTGDGLFVYQSARLNPRKFYIGIDANVRPLEKISEKIHRKPAKGGLPNVLFLQAAIEDLPDELNDVADEIHVHFPWGSLLRAVMVGEPVSLAGLRRLCAPDALLEVIVGADEQRDAGELERLGVTSLSVTAIPVAAYAQAGFEIIESGERLPAEWPDLETSWAKRLRNNPARSLLYFVAKAAALPGEEE
ncbi:MAG TPA: methyltransferase domain-containing protein [Pyrinomonadaceae bacterium]|nr:methyltransferase domain-containing protein [Pyrinomonadaceae bacterium]